MLTSKKENISDFLVTFRHIHLSTFFPILAYALLPVGFSPVWLHHLFQVMVIPPSIGQAPLVAFLLSPMMWYYGSFTVITMAIIALNHGAPKLIEYMWISSSVGCLCAMLGASPLVISFFFTWASVFPLLMPRRKGFQGGLDKLTSFCVVLGMCCLLFLPFYPLSKNMSLLAAFIVALVAPALLLNYFCYDDNLKKAPTLKRIAFFSWFLIFCGYFVVLGIYFF